MLAFEVAYSEDPVVTGAGEETYRRPVRPLAPLGTILLPVGCLVRPRQRPQRQYSLPRFSLSAATGRVIRHRQRRFSLPSDSEVGPQIGQCFSKFRRGTGRAVSAFLVNAPTIGWWSVRTMIGCPSRYALNLSTAYETASSSLSVAE